MKIAILTNRAQTGSGWARYSLDLSEALQKQGVDIFVVTQKDGLPEPLQSRRIALFAKLYAMKLLMRHGAALRSCDLVHCFAEPYAPIAATLAALLEKPYVQTMHGSFSVKPLIAGKALERNAYARAYRKAKAIICISKYTQARLTAILPGLPTVAINNGVSLEPISASLCKSDGSSPLILSVGAIKRRKGQHLLVEAMPEVCTAVPHSRLIIVGAIDEKPYFEQLKKRIEELDLREAIEIKSGVPDAELNSLFEQAALFALAPVSTPTDFEGFGLVYLEAAARGIPSVGMEGSGAAEAIQSGVSGLIAKKEDAQDLAHCLARILSDSSFRQNLSDGARRWAQSHDWNIVAAGYLERYRTLLQA